MYVKYQGATFFPLEFGGSSKHSGGWGWGLVLGPDPTTPLSLDLHSIISRLHSLSLSTDYVALAGKDLCQRRGLLTTFH